MKKIFIVLLLLLLACGCTTSDENADAKLSEEYDTTYFEYDGKQYTKNEVFQRLKAQSVQSTIEALVAKQALDAEGYDFTEKNASYEEQYDMVLSMYGEEMVKQYYGEKEDFVKMLQVNDATNTYITNYVDKRLASLIEKYPSEYVEYISTTDKDKATKFQKLVAKGSTFDEAFEKVEFEQSEGVTTKVISSTVANFPDVINEEYKKLEAGKVSAVLEYTQETEETTEESSENTEPTIEYYIIRLISNDAENDYKDEFINYVIQNEGITSVFDVLEEDHKINFYDDDFMYTYNQLVK